MRSPRPIALLLAAAALFAAGCGSSNDDGLLRARDARALEEHLEDARRAYEDRRCVRARAAARDGLAAARDLPNRVDRELRDNLVEGFQALIDRIEDECREPEKTPTATPEPTPTPTSDPGGADGDGPVPGELDGGDG